MYTNINQQFRDLHEGMVDAFSFKYNLDSTPDYSTYLLEMEEFLRSTTPIDPLDRFRIAQAKAFNDFAVMHGIHILELTSALCLQYSIEKLYRLERLQMFKGCV